MRWIIGSDLHGSAEYTARFLEAAEAEKADRILLLGDILYHGPRNALPEGYGPMGVFEMLNRYKDKILCVRGNCDAEIDQCVLEFPIMAEYMQIVDSGKLIFATHGDHYNTGHLPPLSGIDVLLHGHTHVPACEEHGSHIYLNPGSVSIPKEGSPRSYMTLEDGLFQWKTLTGENYREYRAETQL